MRFRKYRAVSLTTMAQVLIRKLILGLFQGGKKWVRSSAEATLSESLNDS